MGLLKAVSGAMGSVLEEQWREFFLCDALSDDTLLVRAYKRIGARSANTRKDDNVLTNGSILSVADGQCVLVVKQGKVIDVCTEPGEHVFEDPEQGGLKGFFKEVGRRVSFGGGDIQPTVYRVYYMNTKEITGNPFRTAKAIPFRVKDTVSGMDLDSSVFLDGVFSYRVTDPVKLYRTIIGNVSGTFTRRELNAHLQADVMKHLQPALARLSEIGLRPSDLPKHTEELCEALREEMNSGWSGAHGLALASVALRSASVSDAGMVQSAQHAAMLTDPEMAAAVITQSVSEALPAAAANPATRIAPVVLPVEKPGSTSWTCSCGAVSDGGFCPECGKPRPEEWICVCGASNKGRFCRECGAKRPG